ncbi:MAG: feruloyl-CoA synthase [Rhodocyclales bacterium]|nr:feruloyl-CoA synthase [Rhodocyclales bacterium]
MSGGFDWKPVEFRVRVEQRDDGATLIEPTRQLGDFPLRVTDRLGYWAEQAPDRIFVAQRDGSGSWQTLTYRETLGRVRNIAAALALRQRSGRLSPDRPIAILSGNSVEHLLLALAAMHVGVPYTPVSTAYAQATSDFNKLRYVFQLLTPGMVAAFGSPAFDAAIRQTVTADMELVTDLAGLAGETDQSALEATHREVNADTIAKFLLTSGSTGNPKAVITTHRMLCSNQVMLHQALPFMREEPPVLVDWLPWNHTFGGSHNVNLVLFNGGSLYIDNGRPMPGSFEQTLRNLRDISPTVYFNVPKGFELLVVALAQVAELRQRFFQRLRACFFAGAGLSQPTWDALNALAQQECGSDMPVITGLGATETAPSVCFTRPGTRLAGAIGLPAIGNVVKLAPVEGKLEMRVKGPNVTPGYWRQPETTAAAFDEEGYYRLGDAVRWMDAQDIGKGLMFDGRIAEDFKLSSGTWVSVGPLRAKLLSALAPYAQDVVIAGLNRDELGILIFPDWRASAGFLGVDAASPREKWPLERLQSEIRQQLQLHNSAHPHGSTIIRRALLMLEPPSLDRGEITDKGSINQRMVLGCRAEQVTRLFEAVPDSAVIVA